MTDDYSMAAFSPDGPLPLHITQMTPQQKCKFERLASVWPAPTLDPDNYVADDDLAMEVLRETSDAEYVAEVLSVAAGVKACEASRRIATEALVLATAADLPQLIAEAESLLGRIERDIDGE